MDIDQSRSADEAAFLRRFMGEERVLLRFILRYVPAINDARDVLQETLVTLWAKRAEFDESREFLPWACGIARHKVREFWRKQPRWQAFGQDDLMALIDTRCEELAPQLSLRREKLRDCLAKLPAHQRSTLERFYGEEESVETLALREGRSTDAIYKMLQRIRRALQECVERGVRSEITASGL
jgi:RNA polymerase sigma-70 factor (ECF subfamily)